jgi:hypothetical protein
VYTPIPFTNQAQPYGPPISRPYVFYFLLCVCCRSPSVTWPLRRINPTTQLPSCVLACHSVRRAPNRKVQRAEVAAKRQSREATPRYVFRSFRSSYGKNLHDEAKERIVTTEKNKSQPRDPALLSAFTVSGDTVVWFKRHTSHCTCAELYLYQLQVCIISRRPY